LTLLAGCAPAGQRELAATATERADLVERSLLPAVRVAGRQYASATIAERLHEYGVPAVSIAVIDGGAVAWARAYGAADMASGRVATTATLFQAASMSKAVASIAALQLVQEGILALDAPVNESLRSWRIPENAFTAGQPVTLRHLLTHTSGLTVSGFPGYPAGASIPTVTQILDGVPPAITPPVRVESTPGSQLKYSGGGMTVVQLLLAEVTGKDFRTLMRERVLGPVGMHRSTWEQPLSNQRAHHVAAGHQTSGTPMEGAYHIYPELAAAGLWTTPTELAGLVLGIQRALQGEPGALLSRETARTMVTAGLGGWGLGVQVMGSGDSLAFTHSGGNAGFRGLLVGFAEGGRGAVVMTNSDAGSRLVNEIMQAVARAYEWPGFRPTVIVPVNVTRETLQAYAAPYELAGGPRVRVSAEGSALWLTLPWGERRELVLTGNDAFGSPEGGSGRFLRDAHGRVTAMVLGDDQLHRVQ